MASDLITNFDSWNPTELNYGNVKVNARGGKNIKIMDSKNCTLTINTPLMLTWGINRIDDENTGRTSYNLSLQYESEEYASETNKVFFQKMKDFENTLLDDAVKNSKEWFNKTKMSREVVEALYSPMLKYPNVKGTKEPDYSRMPTTRVKIPYWDEKFNVELYNPKREALYMPGDDMEDRKFEDFIPKASKIAVVMQCNGIWFVGGKFGISFQMLQCIVQPPVRIRGSCFVNLVDSDKKLIEKSEEEEEIVDVSADGETVTESTIVEDSDDEIQTEVKEEVEEVLAEEKKKKPRRKKAVTKEV